ncbi:MAG TPA: BTAD domain-containing putative transcriptional regulator [Vicinamibacteria bacterium]|nr:BTAD domain-containing putative transcriptional regulator [Vicinamibacteria bacterium]
MHLWSRTAVSVVALCLALLVGAAARELFGDLAGLIALWLFAFEPNLLVHGSLVTTDLAVCGGYFAAAYGAFRHAAAPSAWRLLSVSLACGVAVGSKHSGLLVLPSVAALLALSAWKERGRARAWARLAAELVAVTVVAFLVLWADYGFRRSALPGGVAAEPAFRALVGQVAAGKGESRLADAAIGAARAGLVPEAYGWGLAYVAYDAIDGRPVWLLGQAHPTGQWYYFPLVILVKTPLPLLLLAAAAAPVARRRRDEWQGLLPFLLVPTALWLAVSVATPLNIGVRHALPVFPFLIVAAAGAGAALARWNGAARALVGLLLMAQAVSVLRSEPHLLGYANEAFGGSARLHGLVRDSSADWGQGLKAVRAWELGHPSGPCWFAPYGTGDPVYYGISCRLLPIGFSLSPAPGTLLDPLPEMLEGTLLVSVGCPLRPFWAREPDEVIAGGSVLVFRGRTDVRRLAASVAWQRALQLLSLGRPEDALTEARKSLALDPGDPRAHLALARAQARAGSQDEARRAYARARAVALGADEVYLKGVRSAIDSEPEAWGASPDPERLSRR